MSKEFDPDDPLFRPISIRDAMKLTGRSRDTIDRWIKERLRVVRLQDPPEDALIEREVVDMAIEKRRAARRGRPRANRSQEPPGERGGSA